MGQQCASGDGSEPTPLGPIHDEQDHGGSQIESGALPDASEEIPRIDIDDPAFAVRLARVLVHRRESIGVGLGAMARRSNGSLTRTMLRELEAGTAQLDPGLVSRIVALYGVDLDDITPARIRIRIDRAAQTVSAGGVAAHFDETDTDELLRTYLRLVRRLRDQHDLEIISLRSDDVEDLAKFLDQPTESVLNRLCDLMGSTRTQRRTVIGMCLAGAMMVTIAVPSAAALRSESSTTDRSSDPGRAERSVIDSATPRLVDPRIEPFSESITPFELRSDVAPPVIVDVDGTWDRDRVLDAEGRLRAFGTERSDADGSDAGADDAGAAPAVDAPAVDEVELDQHAASPDEDRIAVLPPPGTGPAELPRIGADNVWTPPFPDRIVDPGIRPDD